MAGEEEVVAALAQMAFMAVLFSVIVVAMRILQGSADKKQAARALQGAVECSRQRLRTLADRNALYVRAVTSASTTPLDGASVTFSLELADENISSLGSCDQFQIQDGSSCSYGRGAPAAPGAEPASANDSGSGQSLFAAASALWHRRNTSSTLTTIHSDCHSDFSVGTASTAGVSSSIDDGSVGRSISGIVWFGNGGDQVVGRSTAARVGRGSCDSRTRVALRQTSIRATDVLDTVSQETIMSTRQVLASFNYDYSALHRREATYATSTFGRGGRMRSGV